MKQVGDGYSSLTPLERRQFVKEKISLDQIDVVHRNSSLIPPGDDDADHNVKTGVPSFDQQDELWLARGIEVRFKLDGKIGC